MSVEAMRFLFVFLILPLWWILSRSESSSVSLGSAIPGAGYFAMAVLYISTEAATAMASFFQMKASRANVMLTHSSEGVL